MRELIRHRYTKKRGPLHGAAPHLVLRERFLQAEVRVSSARLSVVRAVVFGAITVDQFLQRIFGALLRLCRTLLRKRRQDSYSITRRMKHFK